MSIGEFSEWLAYARLEPFGEGVADLRAGIIASTIANVHRGKGKPFTPQDFMPYAKNITSKPRELWNKMKAALNSKGT